MKSKTDIDKLRRIVKEEILKEMEDHNKQRSLHDIIVDVTKAAANGMKSIESLKTKSMPTQKATAAVSDAITALEHIFHDMSTNPTRYLDEDPDEVVQKHMRHLDDKEASLRDSQESGKSPVKG